MTDQIQVLHFSGLAVAPNVGRKKAIVKVPVLVLLRPCFH